MVANGTARVKRRRPDGWLTYPNNVDNARPCRYNAGIISHPVFALALGGMACYKTCNSFKYPLYSWLHFLLLL